MIVRLRLVFPCGCGVDFGLCFAFQDRFLALPTCLVAFTNMGLWRWAEAHPHPASDMAIAPSSGMAEAPPQVVGRGVAHRASEPKPLRDLGRRSRQDTVAGLLDGFPSPSFLGAAGECGGNRGSAPLDVCCARGPLGHAPAEPTAEDLETALRALHPRAAPGADGVSAGLFDVLEPMSRHLLLRAMCDTVAGRYR